MIASLPMYWRAETAAPWRRFWAAVQDICDFDLPELIDPAELTSNWTTHWLAPDLACSMTCGLPLRSFLKGKVTYVGTFDFGLDAPAGHYNSTVIGKKGASNRLSRLAYNAADSQSGWAAVWDTELKDHELCISELIETGSHAASLQAVADGRADVAWIDTVTWRLLRAQDKNADQVEVIGQSPAYPGLPLIAALGVDPEPLRRALRLTSQLVRDSDRELLGGLCGFEVLDENLYHKLPLPPVPNAQMTSLPLG